MHTARRGWDQSAADGAQRRNCKTFSARTAACRGEWARSRGGCNGRRVGWQLYGCDWCADTRRHGCRGRRGALAGRVCRCGAFSGANGTACGNASVGAVAEFFQKAHGCGEWKSHDVEVVAVDARNPTRRIALDAVGAGLIVGLAAIEIMPQLGLID